MEKEFVAYAEALALKELGFNEPCFGKFYTKPKSKMFGIDEKGRHYQIKNTPKKLYTVGEYFVLNDNIVIIAPTFSQAFRWFREKYNLFGCIDLHISTPIHWFIRIDKIDINDYLYHSEDENIQYSTYEEAELACLKKLIEIVKND